MTTARASANGALTFPEGFAWGTATASYQIEGAVSAGRPGPVGVGHVQPGAGQCARRATPATSPVTPITGTARTSR